MKDSSVMALLAFAAILLVPGSAVISPDGRIFFLALAAICAALAALGGKKKTARAAAAVVLLASLALAFSTYPEHRASYGKYRGSLEARSEAGK